jgi:hypothetical protein
VCVQASLPAVDVQQSLRGVDPHSEQYAYMPDGEQFVAQLCAGATMVSARVGALVFMMRFDETVGDLKPVCLVFDRSCAYRFQGIVAVTAACEEIRKSRGFAAFLELTLLTGNYMSASSTAFKQPVYAFNVANLMNVRSAYFLILFSQKCRFSLVNIYKITR